MSRFAGDFDEGIIVTPEHQIDPENTDQDASADDASTEAG